MPREIPPPSSGNGGLPAGMDPGSIAAAAQLIAVVMKAIPLGSAPLTVVVAPMHPLPAGGFTFDLQHLSVVAPDSYPKSIVSTIEAAIETWAERTRKELDASRIVTL